MPQIALCSVLKYFKILFIHWIDILSYVLILCAQKLCLFYYPCLEGEGMMPQLALYIVYKYYIRFYFMWTLSYIFKYSIYLKEAGLLPVFPLYFVFTYFKILFKVTFVLLSFLLLLIRK